MTTTKRAAYSRGYIAARAKYPRHPVSAAYTRTVAASSARKGSSRWYVAGWVRAAMDLTADASYRQTMSVEGLPCAS